MARDWHAWHEEYDDPASSLSRRLAVVRRQLLRLLQERPQSRLLSLCAGDGRDVLPVLRGGFPEVWATLVELDPELADSARRRAAEAGLRVDVRTADAGATGFYADVAPVGVLMACGIFGNISEDDLIRTIPALAGLLDPGGVVIWTRGSNDSQHVSPDAEDPSERVRELFADAGFLEDTFVRPADARFRVGVHRWTGGSARSIMPGRLFSFV